MEREILFRGKKKLTDEWIYGSLIQPVSGIKSDRVYIGDFWSAESVYPATVGRYTGLDDKNGVKIFNGDILQREVYVYEIGKLQPDRKRMMRGVVIWDETSKTFPPYWAIQAEDEHGNLCKYVFDCGFEVIGNIHDNPELLEVQWVADMFMKTVNDAPTIAPPPNDPLTLEELREMDIKEWVWIEILKPRRKLCKDESAYYRKSGDYTDGECFCCGYPGIGYEFEFCDYGNTWLAYRRKPEEVQT